MQQAVEMMNHERSVISYHLSQSINIKEPVFFNYIILDFDLGSDHFKQQASSSTPCLSVFYCRQLFGSCLLSLSLSFLYIRIRRRPGNFQKIFLLWCKVSRRLYSNSTFILHLILENVPTLKSRCVKFFSS